MIAPRLRWLDKSYPSSFDDVGGGAVYKHVLLDYLDCMLMAVDFSSDRIEALVHMEEAFGSRPQDVWKIEDIAAGN